MARQTGWGWKQIVLAFVGVAASMVLLLVATAAAGFVWASSTAERLGEPAPEPVASPVAIRDAGVQAASAASTEQPLRVEIEPGGRRVRGASGSAGHRSPGGRGVCEGVLRPDRAAHARR